MDGSGTLRDDGAGCVEVRTASLLAEAGERVVMRIGDGVWMFDNTDNGVEAWDEMALAGVEG